MCALWRICTAAREAGSVAELPADCKSAKYTDLDTRYSSQPVAVETLGPINDSAREFLFNLGRKISLKSGDDRESSLLFQRISVLIHRFNAILLQLCPGGGLTAIPASLHSVASLGITDTEGKQDAQLSQRDRAAGCVTVFAESKRLELGDNILRTL